MENTKDISPTTNAERDLVVDKENKPAISKEEIAELTFSSTKETEKEKGFKEGLSNNSDTEANNPTI